jgi:DNA-binding LacI/PurR family transcriptional regulator
VLGGYGSHVIDGLILSATTLTAQDVASQELDIPTVLVGEKLSGCGLVSVAIDNVAAAREATTHLIDTGRRRIAAVGANLDSINVGPALARVTGYLEAHETAALAVAPELTVATKDWTWSAGYAAVDELLHSGAEVDALFCFNDVIAIAAMRAIADHGLTIPGDIAVCGWDDIAVTAFTTPSLTTVRPDKSSIAHEAVESLLAQISGEAVTDLVVTCDHLLVVRESTAPRSSST